MTEREEPLERVQSQLTIVEVYRDKTVYRDRTVPGHPIVRINRHVMVDPRTVPSFPVDESAPPAPLDVETIEERRDRVLGGWLANKPGTR